MLIEADRTPTNLQALANGKVDRAVRDDDVAALAERRDDAGDGGEGLRVHDAALGAETGRDVGFGLHVDVLRAVELGRAARPDAVGAEGLDGFLFDLLVADEVVEVVGGEVGDGAAVGESGFGAGGAGGWLVYPYMPRECSGNLPNYHR